MESIANDTLKTIQETAVKASGADGKVALLKPGQEPDHVYLMVGQSGKVERVVADAKPRAHRLVTLEQVVAFVTKKGTAEASVVWYDRSGVIVIVDDATRRDRADLTLTLTPQIQLLIALEKGRQFTQREFRRLLRVELAGCRVDDVLLNWVSSVKFNDSRTAGGVIKQGRESLGREIEQAAVSDAGEPPEIMRLSVRVFDDPSLRETWPIECAVEIDLDNQVFQLIPLPLQLHNAIENEVGAIGKLLQEAVKCPAFRGKP